MESELQDLADKTVRYITDFGVDYCDVRAEQYQKKSALIENNNTEYIKTNSDSGVGIKIAKNGIWSFCSITNPKSFEQIKEEVNKYLKKDSTKKDYKKKSTKFEGNATTRS